MSKTEIINALVPAHLQTMAGKMMTKAEMFAAGKALGALRLLETKERVKLHEEIKVTAARCMAA